MSVDTSTAKGIEKYLDDMWAVIPLNWKARVMLKFPDGLDPVRIAVRALVEQRDKMLLERDSARDQFDKHVECAALVEERDTLTAIAEKLIAYYTHRGGCGNCGGLPHSTTCFVGLFEAALASPAQEPK